MNSLSFFLICKVKKFNMSHRRDMLKSCPIKRYSCVTAVLNLVWWAKFSITVRSLISGKSFLLTQCHQKCVRKEISRHGFLNVNRYSVVHSIELRRVFFALRKYFDTHFSWHFWWQCVMPGVAWWVVWLWAESPIQI
jgi:hypothetical protein